MQPIGFRGQRNQNWFQGALLLNQSLSGRVNSPNRETRTEKVIADYLRVRAHRLRPATPFSGHTKALRAVVRTRGDLVDARVAATNQLAALLDTHWPGAKTIFANISSAIALAFLTRYRSPCVEAYVDLARRHGATDDEIERALYDGIRPTSR